MTTFLQRIETYDPDGNLVDVTTREVELPPPSREESAALAARLTVVDKVRADELDEQTIEGLVSIFPDLTADQTVDTGEVYAWDGTLVEALQPHTVEAWWLDLDELPAALYKIYRTDPGIDYPDWEQPTSTNPYNALWDDGSGPVIVRHNGRLWENTHGDGNVWEPGVFGWTDIGPA